jgi:hypothetical protein
VRNRDPAAPCGTHAAAKYDARWRADAGTLAWVRVVIIEIAWDGSIRRRALDSASLIDPGRCDNLIAQVLAIPPPYRASPGRPVYVLHASDRAVVMGEDNLIGSLRQLVTTVLAAGEPCLCGNRAGGAGTRHGPHDRAHPSVGGALAHTGCVPLQGRYCSVMTGSVGKRIRRPGWVRLYQLPGSGQPYQDLCIWAVRGGEPGYWGVASVVRVNHTVLPVLEGLAPQVVASASTRVRPRPLSSPELAWCAGAAGCCRR